jgi:acyl CoA:acetate/3-ketoacid CoA transferase beta subunit
VSTLATNEGLFVKNDSGFILKGYYPKPGISEVKERVNQIADACGWQLHTAPQLEKMSAPTPEELKLLRSFDPDGVFLR